MLNKMDTSEATDRHGVMEPDSQSDYESSSGGNDSIYTESLRSSLMQSVQENGRGYHRYQAGKYIIPEDEKERDRLDFQHQLFALTFNNSLILAPIPDQLDHVLDIGTGTGIWAMDFADQHPETSVLGVDLSAMQPSSIPPNCKFEIDDVEEPWTFPQQFDLVHSRVMVASLADWPKFFSQAFKGTKPGGWLEMQDVTFPPSCDDGTMPEGCGLRRWSDLMIQAGEVSGREVTVPWRYKQWMLEAGYRDVTEIIYKWPMNPWPKDKKLKELGRWGLVNMLDGLYGFTVALFTRALGMTAEEVEAFLIDVRKDIEDRKIHSYWPIHVVYGRKPLG